MRVALQTTGKRLDLFVNRQRFVTYRYGDGAMPGFSAIYAPDNGGVTRPDPLIGCAFGVAHGDVNGVAFRQPENEEATGQTGRLVTTELMARRGSYSVGFQHQCDWVAPDGRILLSDTRTARVLSGPGDGRILDWSLRLQAPEESAVTFGRSADSFVRLRAASPLFPNGGGQLRNSVGGYGVEALHGRSAAWCACIGVVDGDTVGFALLDHPDNLWHPAPWSVQEDGTLSPSPLAWRSLELSPRGTLTLRYRLLVHRGYVDAGWATERLREFAKERG